MKPLRPALESMVVISSKKVAFCSDCILWILFIFILITMFGPNYYLNYVTGHKQSWLLGRFYFIVSIVRSHLHGSMSRSLLSCDILFSLLSLFAFRELLCSQHLFAESCCQLCMVGFKTGGKP